MLTPDDLAPETEPIPTKSDESSTNNSLEKTQFFADDSASANSPGSKSTASGDPQSSSKKGQKIVGGYRLIKMLGEGGMGRVYQAADDSGRMVAIKLLSPELSRSSEALDRFRLEGVIASAISHPHCVFVHRADEDAGTPFIAMELMTGQTLKDIVTNRGAIAYSEAIPLILQCIDGLIEAHSRGMIHRDVKPANCYLDDQGNVKIGDFGLARSLISDSELTRTGSFLGTPLYASPEQILGEKVDEQSDIYSLAATTYFLLAGKAPFESPHATQVIAKIVSADPPSFAEAGVQVPKKLEQVVMRGLARDRSKRFANFQEFRDELKLTLGQQDRVATLPRRALAYTIDTFFISLSIGFAVLLTIFFGETKFELQYYINFLGTLWQGIYLLASEFLFGTTIGKKLLNLRVVDPVHGSRPTFRSCLIRVAVFLAVMNAVEWVTVAMMYAVGTSPTSSPILFGSLSWLGILVGCIVIAAVWKKRDKKELLHEWLSKTQTWVSSQKSISSSIELPETGWSIATLPIEANSAVPSRLGRFEIRGRIATEDDSQWLSAYDSTIERSVWIQLSPATSPPPSQSRENCVRRTRMRFLETGIDGQRRWDAYVAPDGSPMFLRFNYRNPMPWPVTQRVMRDAIEEIQSSDSIASDPAVAMERWWLTSSGKLTLSEATVKTMSLPNSRFTDSKPLFSELACLALPDRRNPRSPLLPSNERPVRRIESQAIAPWRATQFLDKLKSGKIVDLNLIKTELDRVSQGPQLVTVTMRVVHAVVLAMVAALPWLILTVILLASIVVDIIENQKDARSLTTLAAILRDPENQKSLVEKIDASKLSRYLEPDQIAQIDEIANSQRTRFLAAYNQLGFLERNIIDGMNRLRGRENFTAAPTPDFSSFEGFENANEPERNSNGNIKPNMSFNVSTPGDRKLVEFKDGPQSITKVIERFEKLELELSSPAPKRWFNRLRDIILIPLGVIVVWGGLSRGGLTHAVSGIAVVRRDGRRGWILQCMWRSFLFWMPLFLVAGAILVVDAHGTSGVWWSQQLRRLYFVLPILYLVVVIRWPNRGPHDIASGTFVVPR